MYNTKLTYPITELNSSFFLEELRNVLQIELLNQRTTFNKTFLPQLVKKDDYLLNPITDSDLNPAFCAIVKAKSTDDESAFNQTKSVLNIYLVKIAAYGLDDLRLIQDAIFQILNDLDVKHYFFQLKREVLSGNILVDTKYLVQSGTSINYNGSAFEKGNTFIGVDGIRTYLKTSDEIVVNSENNIIFDDNSYTVNSIQSELEVEKTDNDRNLITGVIQISVKIAENIELNKTNPIEEIKTNLQLGEDKKGLLIETIY